MYNITQGNLKEHREINSHFMNTRQADKSKMEKKKNQESDQGQKIKVRQSVKNNVNGIAKKHQQAHTYTHSIHTVILLQASFSLTRTL